MEYAHINRYGKAEWTSPKKKHPDMLPVYRDEPSVNIYEYHIQRKPKRHWVVENGKVFITYDVIPLDLKAEIRKAIKKANNTKNELLNSGVEVTINQEIYIFETHTDSVNLISQAYLDQENRPGEWDNGKRWRMQDAWVTIYPEDVKEIMKVVAEHTEVVFDWYERAETEFSQATSVEDLRNKETQLNDEIEEN